MASFHADTAVRSSLWWQQPKKTYVNFENTHDTSAILDICHMQCRFLETSALWNNMNLSIVWWIIINSCVLVQKSGIIVENPSLACFFGWNFLGENSGNENKMANITSELCMQHCYLCIQEMLPLRNTSVAKSFWKQGHPDSCCWSSNEHELKKNTIWDGGSTAP